jgi:uncharacterized protein (TIGR02266 family)
VVERERRAHPRKLVSTGVSFNDIEGATLRGWLHDISRGGCFVATPSLFTFGEELTIVLTLPFPRQRLAGKVRVAWIREKNDKDMPAGMGLQFVDVNEDALVAIDKLAVGTKISRPNTVIGIAPPAMGSSPSYSDVKIPLPTPEDLAKPLPVPGLDAGATEPEGVPIVQLPESEPPPPPPAAAALETETEPMKLPPVLGPPPEPEPEPKKSGRRDKLLIGGAAAVSIAGLVALGVVFTRNSKTTPAVDAATSATVVVVDAAPVAVVVPDAAMSSVAVVVTPPPPIVDASVVDAASSTDAGPKDAGADGGKKKPTKPKPKHR